MRQSQLWHRTARNRRANARFPGATTTITETNRIQLVQSGMQNSMIGPYLVAIDRILISLVNCTHRFSRVCGSATPSDAARMELSAVFSKSPHVTSACKADPQTRTRDRFLTSVKRALASHSSKTACPPKNATTGRTPPQYFTSNPPTLAASWRTTLQRHHQLESRQLRCLT
jgi:hypothetical protein